MNPRPYKYYNTSQILSLIQSNPDNLEVAMNVAYEIACRRRISQEKRVGVITKLEEITVNAIDSKDNEIQELKRRLNNKEQRIKELEDTENNISGIVNQLKEQRIVELEDTEKIISGSIKNLKDEILQSIHQELGDLKLTLSDSSTYQKNTINELKSIITKVDQKVAVIKETIEIKADKKEIRIPEDSNDSSRDSFPSDEMDDTTQDIKETTTAEISTGSDNLGNKNKIGEDNGYNLPTTSGEATGNGRLSIDPP